MVPIIAFTEPIHDLYAIPSSFASFSTHKLATSCNSCKWIFCLKLEEPNAEAFYVFIVLAKFGCGYLMRMLLLVKVVVSR